MSATIFARLTPKSDQTPHTCKLKVYWKTTKEWTNADVKNYHATAAQLAEHARTSGRKFTCEDFALEVLCRFASKNGLPVKLTDGVREYRNMDIYDPDFHENYPQTPHGFIDMVMATFGAPDIQRAGLNTVRLGSSSTLEAGDILALALDAKGRASNNKAHHIQVVVRKTDTTISIYQGNSDWTIHKPITWLNKLFQRNSAEPEQSAYAGMTPEVGEFTLMGGDHWDYKNLTTKSEQTDFLQYFEMYRWNFMGFNN
jgi:hypothetical protein